MNVRVEYELMHRRQVLDHERYEHQTRRALPGTDTLPDLATFLDTRIKELSEDIATYDALLVVLREEGA